jgi:hypothetical protein
MLENRHLKTLAKQMGDLTFVMNYRLHLVEERQEQRGCLGKTETLNKSGFVVSGTLKTELAKFMALIFNQVMNVLVRVMHHG